MHKFIKILLLLLITCQVGAAEMEVDVFIDEALGKYTLPRNFRATTKEYLKKINTTINTKGLSTLKISGSAQFSEATLKAAMPLMPAKNVFILDLRLESHGFVNGIPISWYGLHNGANLGKTTKEIKKTEHYFIGKLQLARTITIYNGIKINGSLGRGEAVTVNLGLAETEEHLVKRLGLGYKRMYVLDHSRPDNAQIDEFVKFVKKLPQESWLHFHCRGGRGRSTTFMAMYDMLKNAHQVSFEDIIKRQTELGGVDLLKPEVDWRIDLAVERDSFIRQFYLYAQDPHGFAERNWSEWLDFNAKHGKQH